MLLWSVGLSQAAHYDAPVVSPEVIAQRVELSDAERAWIAQKKPVRIRVAENSPEQFMESGKAHGLAVDYVKLICEAHHLQCEFVPLLGGTFAESLQKMGQLDGPDVLLTARRTSERERFAGFTRPYLFTPWVIVARQDADPIFSLADLSGKKVVLEKGYVIRQRLSTDVPNLQIIDAKNTPEALNLLASGVADAYVGNLTTATFLSARLGLSNLRVVAPTNYPVQGESMMVRKDWPELLSILDKSLGVFTPQERQLIQGFWYSLSHDKLDKRTATIAVMIGFIVFVLVVVAYILFAARLRKSMEAARFDRDTLATAEPTGVETRHRLIGLRDFVLAENNRRFTLESTESLLDQLRPVSAFSNQFSQTIFVYVCLISGAIGTIGYGYLLFQYLGGQDLRLTLLLPLPVALFLLSIGIGVYKLKEVPAWSVWLVVAVLLAGFMLGSYLNGIAPITFVILFVVFFHLVQRPNQAFISSILLLFEVLIALIWFYPDEYFSIGLRALVNGVVALALMRLVMITFSKLSVNATASIQLLDQQASALKNSLLKSEITDQRVNVLNQLGFERAIAELQDRLSGSGETRSELKTKARLCVMRVYHLYTEPRQLTPSEEDVFYSVLVNRLRQVFGPDALLARVGQYDFAVLHVANGEASPEAVHQQLSLPIEINRRKIMPDLRVGALPLVGNWALSPVDLIRNATLAMREATKSAANPVVFFEPTIAQAARFKERISAEIPNAIDRREFRVVYQPIVTLASRRIDKVEALLRWQLGNNGDIGPDVFIPAAENQGLIGRLTDQVFETVCHDRNQWKSLGMMVPDVSVNISATTLQTPESLLSMLKRFDEPGRLKGITVEVTESALIEDPTGAKTSFAALRDLGFGVSLDDFGVGYSSLAYLTSFSLDFLKMDKAFLEGFEKDGARQSVVRAIIGVAHSLGMEVVAEGIETQEQLDLLKDLGCDYGQGYFFSRPLPAEQLVDYLKANRASS